LSGTFIVPNIIGLSQAGAIAALGSNGLAAGTITSAPNATVPIGSVFAQSIPAGTSEPALTPVGFSVSLGILVPDVVNTSLVPVATAAITGAGLSVGTITEQVSATVNVGNIISQSPAAGTYASAGTPVNVVVSSGFPALLMPLVIFEDQATAVTAITSIGLVVGAISTKNSSIFAAGEVMAQNPAAGTSVAYGSVASITVSLGEPIVSPVFNYEPTIISQYANSPTLLQWIDNCNQYFDQSANVAEFYATVWNIDTAIGFGLDILGRIVGVSRLLQIPNEATYFGFDNEHTPPNWDNFGSTQTGGSGMAPFYTGHNASESYLLNDDAYRQLILAKAFANICISTAPAINRILQNLYGPGLAYVLNTGPMSISYNFNFTPSPIQLAILEQSNVIPTPPGVAVTIITP
jgi:beta-lactam-binding protein with PASTA domain